MEDLQGILSRMQEYDRNENTIKLKGHGFEAIIRRNWKGTPKTWLLTEFGPPAGRTMDIPGAPAARQDDTAPLPNGPRDSSMRREGYPVNRKPGERGSFSTRPLDQSGPVLAHQRRAIFASARAKDLSDDSLKRILRSVTGQDSTRALTAKQATEVLLTISRRAAPSVTPWADYVSSPSLVLGQSLHGTRIYESAEDNYFLQQQLANRFTHNYNKATAGLTKDEIARYRLRIDKAGVRVIHSAPLPPKLQKVNDELTRFVFEPMFQRGMKETLVTADRTSTTT